MKIDKNTIKYIANLAMIGISEEEEEKYSKDLEQILTYAEILDNMDLSKFNKFTNSTNNSNKFRNDEVKESQEEDLLLNNAEEIDKGMFKVPKVL